MKTIEIECTNNNMTKTVDVLQENDKYMKVAIQGTQITLELFREDVNMSYVGRKSGLEFRWIPKK
jgi:hypothetical protein|tara:strand:- start:95 stop:289 length:195 start_codon:yes stop_codon:yes gene_type:complete